VLHFSLPLLIVDIEIGEEAFRFCNSLREVILEDDGISIKTIGFAAFSNCKSLESITLPSTLTKIGDSGFCLCTNLRTVVLNEGLKKIDRYAFQYCSSLQSITIPSTVTKIGAYAFEGCERLSEIVILNEMPNDLSFDPLLEEYVTPDNDIIKQVMIACTSRRKRSLVLNFPGLSKRLEYIKISRWLDDINDKIDAIPQIVRRDSGGFLVSTRDRGNRVDWKPLKQSFDKIYQLILYYELKEAASLLELALWKAKIDQVDEEVYPIRRDACRIALPEPAKDLILKFAYHIPQNTATCYPINIKCSRARGVEEELYCVEPSDTIANVKKQISDDKDIAIDQQRLFFDGRELLHDDRTLSDCNIMRDSIIICFEISGD